MTLQLAEWTKPGNWENHVIVQVSLKKDCNLVVLFLPGEDVSVNEQLAKRAPLEWTKGDQEIGSSMSQSIHYVTYSKGNTGCANFDKVQAL